MAKNGKHGFWLSPLVYRECKVKRKAIFWKKYVIKNGYELIAPLVYEDSLGRIHLRKKGYVWDGATKPFRLSSKSEERAMLAASAIHDDFLGANIVYLDLDFKKQRKINIGIIEGARIMRDALISKKYSKVKAWVVFFGIVLFQPFISIWGKDYPWIKKN